MTDSPYATSVAAPAFPLRSSDFVDGSALPRSAWGDGAVTPALELGPLPAGTQSVLVTVFDPDAPLPGGFWHWAAIVPASTVSIPSGPGTADALPAGSTVLANSAGFVGFMGAAPPAGTGRTHHYHVAATALDVPSLELPEHASLALVHWIASGHTLGRAVIVGTADSPAA